MVWIDHDDGHAGGYPHECERPCRYCDCPEGRCTGYGYGRKCCPDCDHPADVRTGDMADNNSRCTCPYNRAGDDPHCPTHGTKPCPCGRAGLHPGTLECPADLA